MVTVRDHLHNKGQYRGAAYNACNIKLWLKKKTIPVVFHSLWSYDSHFMMRAIAKFVWNFTCNPKIWRSTSPSAWGRSGQVWEHAPEQRIAASTFPRYSRSLHLATPQADDWPIHPHLLEILINLLHHEASCRPMASSTHEAPSMRQCGEQD